MIEFCKTNNIPVPALTPLNERWDFSHCAYYRPSRGIVIHVPSCASIGTGGASWSFPGYFIDRTPYGVIQHELGHHVDWLKGSDKGKYFSDFSVNVRKQSGEDKITNYCPNDAEWFAEIFRVFVTNSDLLKKLRPVTYTILCNHFSPVVSDEWSAVLYGAPARNIEQCRKRINAGSKQNTVDLSSGWS